MVTANIWYFVSFLASAAHAQYHQRHKIIMPWLITEINILC